MDGDAIKYRMRSGRYTEVFRGALGDDGQPPKPPNRCAGDRPFRPSTDYAVPRHP